MAKPDTPLLATDAVIFDEMARLLVIRRRYAPFKGHAALPGGFVERGETVEAACARELAEETGIRVDSKALRLVGVYSDPARDPREHIVSVAFATIIKACAPQAGSDAAQAEWLADWRGAPFAFDHSKIAADGAALLGV